MELAGLAPFQAMEPSSTCLYMLPYISCVLHVLLPQLLQVLCAALLRCIQLYAELRPVMIAGLLENAMPIPLCTAATWLHLPEIAGPLSLALLTPSILNWQGSSGSLCSAHLQQLHFLSL